MDRLTDRNKEMPTPISDHAAYYARCVNKLADYEDTGLEPEEIDTLNQRLDENIGFSRLWQGRYFNLLAGEKHTTTQHIGELLEAEHEGRLIVLPSSFDAETIQWMQDRWATFLREAEAELGGDTNV